MWLVINNMGSMTREEMEVFAAQALKEFPGWKMKWTVTKPGICLHKSKQILIPDTVIGQYPWMAKEYILHEVAHIKTWPRDMQHGEEFYREYILLLNIFMLEEE